MISKAFHLKSECRRRRLSSIRNASQYIYILIIYIYIYTKSATFLSFKILFQENARIHLKEGGDARSQKSNSYVVLFYVATRNSLRSFFPSLSLPYYTLLISFFSLFLFFLHTPVYLRHTLSNDRKRVHRYIFKLASSKKGWIKKRPIKCTTSVRSRNRRGTIKF